MCDPGHGIAPRSDRLKSVTAIVASIACWLSLAATPTFLAMAFLTRLMEPGRAMAVCGAGSPWLTGMVPMYLLMSGFHAGPWLRELVGGFGARDEG